VLQVAYITFSFARCHHVDDQKVQCGSSVPVPHSWCRLHSCTVIILYFCLALVLDW